MNIGQRQGPGKQGERATYPLLYLNVGARRERLRALEGHVDRIADTGEVVRVERARLLGGPVPEHLRGGLQIHGDDLRVQRHKTGLQEMRQQLLRLGEFPAGPTRKPGGQVI